MSLFACLKEDLRKSITFFQYLINSHLEEWTGFFLVLLALKNRDKEEHLQGGRFQFSVRKNFITTRPIRGEPGFDQSINLPQIQRAQDKQGHT